MYTEPTYCRFVYWDEVNVIVTFCPETVAGVVLEIGTPLVLRSGYCANML